MKGMNTRIKMAKTNRNACAQAARRRRWRRTNVKLNRELDLIDREMSSLRAREFATFEEMAVALALAVAVGLLDD
jgi:hypothetical protein